MDSSSDASSREVAEPSGPATAPTSVGEGVLGATPQPFVYMPMPLAGNAAPGAALSFPLASYVAPVPAPATPPTSGTVVLVVRLSFVLLLIVGALVLVALGKPVVLVIEVIIAVGWAAVELLRRLV